MNTNNVVLPSSIDSSIKIGELHKKELNNIYDIYSDFIYIVISDMKDIRKLYKELSEGLILTSVVDITMSQVDLAFVKLLSQGKALKDTKLCVKLFLIIKHLYFTNSYKLKNSQQYLKLTKPTRESLICTKDLESSYAKFKFIMKLIDSDSPAFMKILDNNELLPSHTFVASMLWGVIVDIKNADKRKSISKTLKSDDMTCVLFTLFEKLSFKNENTEIDYSKTLCKEVLSELFKCLTSDLNKYIEDINLELRFSRNLTEETLIEDNKHLKIEYKELVKELYQYNKMKSLVTSEICITEDTYRNNISHNRENNIICDIPLEKKIDILSNNNLLLLKKKSITIGKLIDSIRVENIENFDLKILNNNYDAVIFLTKGISHSDFYRVKNMCGNISTISTDRTNTKLILEDIYDKLENKD